MCVSRRASAVVSPFETALDTAGFKGRPPRSRVLSPQPHSPRSRLLRFHPPMRVTVQAQQADGTERCTALDRQHDEGQATARPELALERQQLRNDR